LRFDLRSILVLVLCLVTVFQTAFGWNSIGHMAVAYVAYQRLTPKQQRRVSALLEHSPEYKYWSTHLPANTSKKDRRAYIFMLASTWPDLIKGTIKGYVDDGNTPPATDQATLNLGYEDHFMHKYWHYVDLPFSPDGTALHPGPTVNAQTQIAALRKDLSSTESDSLKSYDLVWLEHLVGDVHQPLHCTSRFTADSPAGDQGGNLVTIDVAPRKLHGYWDNLLGNSNDKDGPALDLATSLAAAKSLGEADPMSAADLNTADWVKESFDLDKSSVYVNPPIGIGLGPYVISATPDYAANSLAVAKQRVALAGARLANVINAELK
jgi:S1/P1 Nuclease